MEEQVVFEALSCYFSEIGPAKSGSDEFTIAVLEKLVELERCQIRGHAKNHVLCSISEITHPEMFAVLNRHTGQELQFATLLGTTKIQCRIVMHTSIHRGHGVVKVQVCA